MARRPEPNPRRGVLRAVLTIIGLSILLLVAILIVSSLTAPNANAPITPPTPGPITPLTTPTAIGHKSVSPVPSPTHKKKLLGQRAGVRRALSLMQVSPSTSLLRAVAVSSQTGFEARSGRFTAQFSNQSIDGAHATLEIASRGQAAARVIGEADPLERPIWSRDASKLLYVKVSAGTGDLGTVWHLMQYDTTRGTVRTLVSTTGVSLVPLGWIHQNPRFLVARTSDTSLYAISAGRMQLVHVLAPQIVTSAALSPGKNLLAFAAPTNCYNCTLEFFDLRRDVAWNGPSGIGDESNFAWSADGRAVVANIRGRLSAVLATSSRAPQAFGSTPLGFNWHHSLTSTLVPGAVTLIDTVTGRAIQRRAVTD